MHYAVISGDEYFYTMHYAVFSGDEYFYTMHYAVLSGDGYFYTMHYAVLSGNGYFYTMHYAVLLGDGYYLYYALRSIFRGQIIFILCTSWYFRTINTFYTRYCRETINFYTMQYVVFSDDEYSLYNGLRSIFGGRLLLYYVLRSIFWGWIL